MASRRRQEGGKKQNAEGMHGDLTHEAIQQQLKRKLTTTEDAPAGADAADGARVAGDGSLKAHVPGPDGKHRLFEDRQQHDEADKNSERNRLARESRGTSPGEK
jgi:hypothetical protein